LLRGGRKKLGDILLKAEIISEEQLEKALELHQQKGIRVGKALIQLGYTTQESLIKALSEQLGIPYISLSSYQIEPSIISLIPENLARTHKLIPLFKIGNTLTVGMVDPLDVFAIDEISMKSKLEIEPTICSEEELDQTLDHYYGSTSTMDEVVQIIQEEEDFVKEKKIDEMSLKEAADDAPIIKLVNLIFSQAIKDKASDVHVEPEEDKVIVRIRIDGVLHQAYSQPKNFQNAIISRIKIMAEMDIAERRLPQDGRFQLRVEDHDVDVRVSTIPTVNGENIVMRLLDKTNVLVNLDDLGFTQTNLEKLKNLINKPYGIILVTGPTGSGKTTTLYAALNSLNGEEKNIVTIEDPIEYRLKMVRQSQVNPKIGLTFAKGLRSILRQDPDIIMVGEIRDTETANVAVQSALTGHLVLSTLHTNDSPGAISRLIDMGVEPFLVSAATIGILAQRLIRKLCPKCKESYEPTPEVLRELKISTDGKKFTFYRAKGCRACRDSGYKGRIGIFELLLMDDNVRNMIITRTNLTEIKKYVMKNGMRSLRQDGILKVIKGITTVEEVIRATQID
jgi:type IV pilus assembly protein PilB